MRIELKGDAQPNPEFALPDPGSDSTLPPLILNLPHGEPFLPGPYIEQGYNRYEVWCIGAAGGHGGNGGANPFPANYPGDPNVNFEFQLSWPYYFSGGVTHYHDPRMDDTYIWGGGGGGGGLHVVSGFLVVLPDECPVVVGQAGADAPMGQLSQNMPLTPPNHPYPVSGEVYDMPHPTFSPPIAGNDGGASSFNGETCRASGGKGGHPSAVWQPGSRWISGNLMIDGQGGEGGIGGQIAPGGGAPGSSTTAAGTDGTWDGAIGKGGGGGRGGTCSPDPPPIPMGV